MSMRHPDFTGERLLRHPQDAASMLGISRRSVDRLVRAGELLATPPNEGERLIFEESIQAYVARRKQRALEYAQRRVLPLQRPRRTAAR